MTNKDNRIEKLLSATSLRIHPHRFFIVSMPLTSLNNLKQHLSEFDAPFWSVCIEEDEITLILPVNTWTAVSSYLSKAKVDEEYRIISLDVATSWDVAGYLTKIMSVLTDEGISTGIVSGVSRNHLLIRTKDLIRAVEVLNKLIETAQ